MRGDFTQVPNDPEPRHQFQRVVGNVNLPPVEALARGSHVVVMVVVPAFAEREDGKQPVVAARVGRFIAARTEQVCERIDGEGVMPEERGAEAEAPEDERKAADEKKRDDERDMQRAVRTR